MKMFNSPSHCRIGGKLKKKMDLLDHLQLRQILNRSDKRNSDIRDMLFYILLTEYPNLPDSFLPLFTDAEVGTTHRGDTWLEVRDFIVKNGYDQQGYDRRYHRIVRYVDINLSWFNKTKWGEGRGAPLRHE